MEIKLVRVFNPLYANDIFLKKINDDFISSINNELFNDDLLLKENAKRPLFSIYFIESIKCEKDFLKIYKKDKFLPTFLMTSFKGGTLSTAHNIGSYLDSIDIHAFIIHGDEDIVSDYIKKFAELSSAFFKVIKSNLGIVGLSSHLIAPEIDFGKVKELFDINTVLIPYKELDEEIKKNEYSFSNIPSSFKGKNINKNCLIDSLNIYESVKRLLKKHKLSGLLIHDSLLSNDLLSSFPLAISLLNEDGYLISFDTDYSTLLTRYLLKCLTEQETFECNIESIQIANNLATFITDTISLNMVSDFSLVPYDSSNKRFLIKGNVCLKECTICKISLNLDHFLSINGNVTKNLNLPYLKCTQFSIESPDSNWYDILTNPIGGKLVFIYEDFTGYFNLFLSFFTAIKK